MGLGLRLGGRVRDGRPEDEELLLSSDSGTAIASNIYIYIWNKGGELGFRS